MVTVQEFVTQILQFTERQVWGERGWFGMRQVALLLHTRVYLSAGRGPRRVPPTSQQRPWRELARARAQTSREQRDKVGDPPQQPAWPRTRGEASERDCRGDS